MVSAFLVSIGRGSVEVLIGGVVDKSSSGRGVVARDGVPDLEVLRGSALPLALRGSAECCRLSYKSY